MIPYQNITNDFDLQSQKKKICAKWIWLIYVEKMRKKKMLLVRLWIYLMHLSSAFFQTKNLISNKSDSNDILNPVNLFQYHFVHFIHISRYARTVTKMISYSKCCSDMQCTYETNITLSEYMYVFFSTPVVLAKICSHAGSTGVPDCFVSSSLFFRFRLFAFTKIFSD